MPTGPETVREHFDFYFGADTPQSMIDDAIRYLDEVLQPEDIGLVESVQRGLHSRAYRQGRFIVDKDRTFISEHGLHHFHSLVLESLGELPPA
jgi:choline monooxygenase